MKKSPKKSGALVLACLALAGCGPRGGEALATVESAYQETRAWKDQIDVTRSRNVTTSTDGVTLPDLVARYQAARARLRGSLGAPSLGAPTLAGLAGEDARALAAIKAALQKDLAEEDNRPAPGAAQESVACDYDPEALAQGPGGLKSLSERMYACFGRAAHTLRSDGQTLDRLTIMSLLPLTDDAQKRRRLFLALEPVWRSINGDGRESSPYRRLVRLNAAKVKAEGSSIESSAKALGADPQAVEGWLTSVLEAWRAIGPASTLEPWDFAYAAGRTSRQLSPAIPREALRALNDRYYRDLGADLAALRVQYDLDPRDGKDPVAFTTFGRRPAFRAGAWVPGEPWVFASYSIGGLDNLSELLHETGHAVHIAAIRTRPAFMDWPDSDTFTEAIADIAALEIYEPVWQRRYLGASTALPDSIRTKYAGIVMDVAWALFEIRLHRDPDLDPNRLWTEITERYLRIKPHPELSWWAVRGQLINLPGYMLNYAVGAILIADLRARAKQAHGPYAEGDPAWYPWMSEHLYRFGLERTSRRVIEDFLGRPVSPRAILDDLARAQDGGAAR